MARKMCIAIATIAVLLSLIPAAHACLFCAHQQEESGIQAKMLYTGKEAMGMLLPNFSENPAFVGGLATRYLIGSDAISGGIHTTVAHPWISNERSGTGTDIFIAAERHLPLAHISAQITYMHNSMPSKQDFFQGDMYETILAAKFTAKAQKPYIFIGTVTPAYIPIQEALGMGGIGLTTHTPITEKAAIHTDSSVATTLLKFGGREQETVLRSQVALEVEPQNSVKIHIGFNVLQDVRMEKYHTWWEMRATYAF